MVSRVTSFSLLLFLLLSFGVHYWDSEQQDACTRYLAGDKTAPSSEWVTTGTRTVAVPCNDWIYRQPMGVQLLCLLDLTLGVLFLMNALGDMREWLEKRRLTRQSR